MQGQGIDLKQAVGKNRWLLVLPVVSILVHFLLLLPALKGRDRILIWPDAIRYERLAENMLDGNVFSVESEAPYLPNSTMTPGFPGFIAAIYAVFGRSAFAVVIIQVILSVGLIAGIIFWSAKKFSIKNALLAGIFLLLNLCLAFYSVQLMTDIIFLCVLFPALWFVLRLFEDRSPLISGAIAGVLLGLATLVRPIGLYFPLMLPFLFLVTRRKGRFLIRLGGYGMLAAVFMIVVCPWFIRNKVTFGRFFFSTVQSFNLSHIHAAPIKASIEGTTIYQAEAEFEEQAYEEFGDPANEAEGFIFTGRIALRYLLNHPGRYAILYAGGVAKTLLPLGFGEFLVFYSPGHPSIRNITPSVQTAILSGKVDKAFRIIWDERIEPVGGWFVIYLAGGLLMVFLLVTSIIGFIKSRGLRNSFNVLAFISVVYFLGVTGPAGQPRHFLPVLPLIAVLAARGLCTADKKKGEG